MVANYLITVDCVKVISDSLSTCSYFIEDNDLILLKNDKEVRVNFLNQLGLNSVIVSSLGEQSEDTFEKKSASIIKVGDKKWE